MTARARRHVVLVGLPGVGKTTVGRLLAGDLKAPFVDLDDVIELSAGKSISRLFADLGEAGFRVLEREAMERAVAGAASVIAAGGGWAAEPGNLDAVAGRAFTVYLRVPPDVAAARVALTTDNRQLMTDRRPLLAGADVARRVRELLVAREGFYERCEASVAAAPDAPARVSEEVAKLARSLAGWY